MIYNQKKLNICFGTAAANIIERVTGNAPRLEDIVDFYNKAEEEFRLAHINDLPRKKPLEPPISVKNGCASVRTFFNKWMELPLNGVKLKSYKPLWALVGFKYRLSPLSLLNRLAKGNFIVTVRTPIKLDKDGYMLPPEDKRGPMHMVCVDRVEGRDVVLENSWGKGWGKSGYFKMRIKDVWSCCLDIWSVEL